MLCDKPFGCSAADSPRMRDLAAAAGALHFLNFENRFDPVRRSIHTAVLDGRIGTPEHFALSMLTAMTRSPLRPYGWLFDAAAGGGWLRALGSHQIDFCRWTFGEIVSVSGQLRTAVTERPDAAGQPHRCTADDGFLLAMGTDRGVSIAMDSSSAAPMHLAPSTVVIGSSGVIEEAGGKVVVRTAGGAEELDTGAAGVPALHGAMQAYAEVIRDAVRTRHVPAGVPTFDDGVACAEVMDVLYRPVGPISPDRG